jgi:hypothetical protein
MSITPIRIYGMLTSFQGRRRDTSTVSHLSRDIFRLLTQCRKLISKVRNVLEAQSPRINARLSTVTSLPVTTELITIHTDVRQFESFLRSINRCSSLLDARRLKNDVVGEIRRTRLSLGNSWLHTGQDKSNTYI